MVNYLHGTISGSQNVYVEILDKVYEGTVKGNIYEVYLPPMEAGGGYKLTVYSDNAKVETTVFIGDVYICSGQSNMEFSLKDSVPGAEEYSAMASAEGQVQEMKYTSTFPLLISFTNCVYGNIFSSEFFSF